MKDIITAAQEHKAKLHKPTQIKFMTSNTSPHYYYIYANLSLYGYAINANTGKRYDNIKKGTAEEHKLFKVVLVSGGYVLSNNTKYKSINSSYTPITEPITLYFDSQSHYLTTMAPENGILHKTGRTNNDDNLYIDDDWKMIEDESDYIYV